MLLFAADKMESNGQVRENENLKINGHPAFLTASKN